MHVVNDNFGMHVGDEVIGKVAEVLRKKARPGALAARIAGDRFAVFLPDCTLEFAQQIGDMLRRQCSELTYARGDGTVQVSVSAGRRTARGIPASARARARERRDRLQGGQGPRPQPRRDLPGRGPEHHAPEHRHGGRAGLHEALAADRFALFAQPILPLGAERSGAAFRVPAPHGRENSELLPPEKFLSAAERYQLLPAIDRWVVKNALATLAAHASSLHGRGMRFSINISGASIASEEFLEFLESSIRESGVPPETLCFELTETSAVSNLTARRPADAALRVLGCTFALDDFGTGLSSLVYLKSLPVSVLKIDGAFVRDAGTNQRTESMVRAIAQLAHTMGMETVAEYVETDECARAWRASASTRPGLRDRRPVPIGGPRGPRPVRSDGPQEPAALSWRGDAALPGRGYHYRMSHPQRTLLAVLSGCLAGVCSRPRFLVRAARPPGRRTSAGRAPARGGHRPIRDDYVDKTDRHELMSKAIRGMVGELDPHSAFMDAEEFEDLRIATEGNYSGIGVEVALERRHRRGRADRRLARRARGHPRGRRDRRDRGPQGRGHGTPRGDREDPRRAGHDREAHARARRPRGPRIRGRARDRLGALGALRDDRAGYGYLRISQFSETTGPDTSAAMRALGSRRAAGCAAWCSISATIRAACSMRRSRFRMPSSRRA